MSKPLDLVLLREIMALAPLHGWAISQRPGRVSDEELQMSDGLHYPALHELELSGWITSEWKTSELLRPEEV